MTLQDFFLSIESNLVSDVIFSVAVLALVQPLFRARKAAQRVECQAYDLPPNNTSQALFIRNDGEHRIEQVMYGFDAKYGETDASQPLKAIRDPMQDIGLKGDGGDVEVLLANRVVYKAIFVEWTQGKRRWRRTVSYRGSDSTLTHLNRRWWQLI